MTETFTTQSPSRVDEVLTVHAARWPNRAALIDESGILTWSDLVTQIENLAAQLARAGVKSGQAVGLRLRSGRAFIMAAFAALRCGGVMVPLSDRMPRAEIAEALREISVHAVIEDSASLIAGHAVHPLSLTGCDTLTLTQIKPSPELSLGSLAPGAAYLRFTSGTTGRAKGVLLTHEDMLARTAAANRGLQITERDVVLCVLPMAFHFVVSILLYMRAGATLVLMPDFLADVTLQTANRHRATVLYATPLHIQLLAALAPPARFETMRRVISTSSALAPDTARAFLERHGLAVEQAYGIIEVGLPLMNCDRAHDRPEALGIPLPDFEVAILDDARRQVPDGTLGELAMRGPGMFSAYVSPPRRRDEVLHDGWFLTGDLARREADGLIVLGGRAKSVINIAGNKVFPEEVERVLCLHTQIAEARVWGRPHPRLGEAVIADVVQRDPKAALDVEALLRHCRAHLSPHKVPLLVNAVDAIDRTQSGKVCRS